MTNSILNIGKFEVGKDHPCHILFVEAKDQDDFSILRGDLKNLPETIALIPHGMPEEDLWLLVLYYIVDYIDQRTACIESLSIQVGDTVKLTQAFVAIKNLAAGDSKDHLSEDFLSSLEQLIAMLPASYRTAIAALEILRDFYLMILLPGGRLLMFDDVNVSAPAVDQANTIKGKIRGYPKNSAIYEFCTSFLTCLEFVASHRIASLSEQLYKLSVYCLWLAGKEKDKRNFSFSLVLLHRACDVFFQSLCASDSPPVIVGSRTQVKYHHSTGQEKERIHLMKSIQLLNSRMYQIDESDFSTLNDQRNKCLLTHGELGVDEASFQRFFNDVVNSVQKVERSSRWSTDANEFNITKGFSLKNVLLDGTALRSYIKAP